MVGNYILRKNARAQLDGHVFSRTWLMLALVFIIYSAILTAGGRISGGIITLVVAGPMLYGTCRICTKVVRGYKKIALEDMFIGFKECFTESFLLSLITVIFTFLWSMLFIVPGIIKLYSYSMASYMLQDDPSRGWEKSLEASKLAMRGNKWQLFCLDLSFIGWYFVGMLAFGVGILLVIPYHCLARANFYMASKAKLEREASNDAAFESA